MAKGNSFALVAQLGEVLGGQQLVEGVLPPGVVFVADLRPEVEPANHRPDDVVALFLGGGDVGHRRLRQAFFGEHREQAHVAAEDVRHGVGNVGAADLDVPAEQRGGDLAAAFQGHVAQVARIDPGGLGDQRGLHPVLAADGAAGADHHLARVGLERLHQVVEVLVGRVGAHRDGAVAGADGGQPFHRVLVEAAELALGQVQQRAAGEGGDGAGVARALGDHRVIGDRADAAGHVGDAHRLAQQLGLDQGALGQLAGEVETAAGGRRGDAFGTLGFGHGGAGQQQAGGNQGEGTKRQFHHHRCSCGVLVLAYQIGRV